MKTYIFPILIFLFSLNIAAQRPDRKEFEALKVAFITKELDLTKAEAEAFWPVFNEFDKTNSKLRYQEMRNIRKEIRDNFSTMTDEKATELLKKMNNLETRAHKNRIEFAAKIREILPAKKIIKLKVAEEDFKRKMLNQWKSRRKGGGSHGTRQ